MDGQLEPWPQPELLRDWGGSIQEASVWAFPLA